MTTFKEQVTPHTKSIIQADETGKVAKQFYASEEENRILAEELVDPTGDEVHSPVEGIVHRHSDRCLLKPINQCAVYCRFCFRKEMIGPEVEQLSSKALINALDYIKKTSTIWEVILTGGDPLMLNDNKLALIIQALNAMQHVKVLRFHTRIPMVAPNRINQKLLELLKSSNKAVYMVVHVNHANEFSEKNKQALSKLNLAGIVLLSQTVLLKGVNDSAETLENLFRRLVEHRVKPYYLHQLDYAKGTSHFRVSIQEGQKLVQTLNEISGLCFAKYILDIPGGFGKVPIHPSYIHYQENTNSYQVRDDKGIIHQYQEFF